MEWTRLACRVAICAILGASSNSSALIFGGLVPPPAHSPLFHDLLLDHHQHFDSPESFEQIAFRLSQKRLPRYQQMANKLTLEFMSDVAPFHPWLTQWSIEILPEGNLFYPGFPEKRQEAIEHLIKWQSRLTSEMSSPPFDFSARDEGLYAAELNLLLHHTERLLRRIQWESKNNYLDLDLVIKGFLWSLPRGKSNLEKHGAAWLEKVNGTPEVRPYFEQLQVFIESGLRNGHLKIAPNWQKSRKIWEQFKDGYLWGSFIRHFKDVDWWKIPMVELDSSMNRFFIFLDEHSEQLNRHQITYSSPTDHEFYELQLAQYGIGIRPAQLRALAEKDLAAAKAEMQMLLQNMQGQNLIKNADIRDAASYFRQRAARSPQQFNEWTLDFMSQIESIIKDHQLVSSLPYPAEIQECQSSESKVEGNRCSTDYPHVIGRSLKQGRDSRQSVVKFPDFEFMQKKQIDLLTPSQLFMLMAHEARPGHELQFETIHTRSHSLAKLLFREESASTEGWGLYAEMLILEKLPPEEYSKRFGLLRSRIWRALRAVIDTSLHTHTMSNGEGVELLMKDAGFEEALAKQEVMRYREEPGRDVSYFYGYSQFRQLREDMKAIWGARYRDKCFHDGVLAESFAPPRYIQEFLTLKEVCR